MITDNQLTQITKWIPKYLLTRKMEISDELKEIDETLIKQLNQKNVGNVTVHSCLKIQLNLQRCAQLKMQS